NLIGTDGDGTNDAAEANVIAGVVGFTNSEILIDGAGTNNNVVAGNFIGANAAGTVGLTILGNCVTIQNGAQNNLIGTDVNGNGSAANEGNVIGSGSSLYGVFVGGVGTNGNVIAGNRIGISAAGAPLANGQGVAIQNGAQNNRVGTDGNGL